MLGYYRLNVKLPGILCWEKGSEASDEGAATLFLCLEHGNVYGIDPGNAINDEVDLSCPA